VLKPLQLYEEAMFLKDDVHDDVFLIFPLVDLVMNAYVLDQSPELVRIGR